MSSPIPPAGGPTHIDERTVVGGDPNDSGNTLPVGHRLQEYVIEGLIGEGGFGIVYLARDTQLGRVVALKEYMPSSLATRGANSEVSVRSARHRETFQLGLRSFVNEAQLLAAFDHPSLVKVYRFWEQHGTAYMVMPYYQGPTLKQWLLEHGARPDEAWLLSILHPLVDALELMHHERCYHRDIAPDNILLLNQQATQLGRPQTMRPVLLDFGAARRVISDATQALTVILKSGYAPIEQYAESTSMKQGAWTDVYALSAVLYAAITGRAPFPSVSRMVSDDLEPAVTAGAGRYSPGFLAAIDAGLAVRPEQRPQDMAALRALFFAGAEAPEPAAALPMAPAVSKRLPPLDADAPTVIAPPGPSIPAKPSRPLPAALPTSIKLLGTPDPVAPSRAGLWVGGGLAVVVLAGAGWWFGLRERAVPPVLDGSAGAASQVAASQAVVAAASAAAVPASAATASAATAVAPTPFTIVAALQDIAQRSNPLLGVNALADKSSIVIGRDRLQFRVRSAKAGYLYVFFAGTEKSHMYLLFPNEIDKENRVEANKEMVLPRPGWHITAEGPPGLDHIVAVVSQAPRDFTDSGLRKAGEGIPEFDLPRAEQMWRERSNTESPFVGKAVCEGASPCDARYGATLLEIEEVVASKK